MFFATLNFAQGKSTTDIIPFLKKNSQAESPIRIPHKKRKKKLGIFFHALYTTQCCDIRKITRKTIADGVPSTFPKGNIKLATIFFLLRCLLCIKFSAAFEAVKMSTNGGCLSQRSYRLTHRYLHSGHVILYLL